MSGTIPPSLLPGRKDPGEEGRPKKYLRGPDLVMSQDTARVPIVESVRIIGKDPKYLSRCQRVLSMFYELYLLKIGVHEEKAAIGTRIC